MHNMYIERDGKEIQLTVDEIKSAWAAWDTAVYSKRRKNSSFPTISCVQFRNDPAVHKSNTITIGGNIYAKL